MSTPALVLFDDRTARDWRPFTLTRPAGELLFGTRTLRARAEQALGLRCHGHLTGAWLRNFDEPGAPPAIEADAHAGGDRVLLLSRFVAEPARLPPAPALLVCGERVVGCRPGPDAAPPGPGFLDDPDAAAPDLPRHELPGTVLDDVWQLMSVNADRVALDLAKAAAPSHAAPAHVYVLGDGPLVLGADVELAPGVVIDTRPGPVRLEDRVTVQPFTHLVGPAWVGPDSILLGGRLSGSSIGPRCRVRGEVEETVVLGYSNKAHDGFLGHSYLGMWVNLGALTTNSDLKNNYGAVRIWTPSGERNTAERKIGCFLGDHVKTAIGTMLNTGTVIEAGSNVFGGMPGKYVPPFSWGEAATCFDLERFLETAATVMGRRDVALGPRQTYLLRDVWQAFATRSGA